VQQLCKGLPYRTPLCALLRQLLLPYPAIFTAPEDRGCDLWPNSSGYLQELKVDKRRANLPCGTLAGVPVDDVLAFVRQDKNLPRFLTTAYPGDSDDVEMTLRRSPRTTAHTQTLVHEVWGENG
jgi:hypothetical protein